MNEWSDFEFERKFFLAQVPTLTDADPYPDVIIQAYLLAVDGYAVRVRIQAKAPEGLRDFTTVDQVIDAIGESTTFATMTAKGPAAGGTRYEAERPLDALVASQIIRRADHVITKVRHSLWLDTDGWIIDEFLGTNAPLVIAEVERIGPVTDLAIPDFCLTEVSEDLRFGNEYLASTPFGTWQRQWERELAVVGPQFIHNLGRNRLSAT